MVASFKQTQWEQVTYPEWSDREANGYRRIAL